MAKSAWIINVEEANFQTEVLDRSNEVPVVVDFWATRCPPCRALAPLLEAMVEERAGAVILAKVNVDDAKDLAGRYSIASIPTVIAFRQGQPVLDFEGLLTEPQLREFFDRLAPSPAELLVKEALALENAKPEEAEKLFRQALEGDRNQETATLGLARLFIAREQDSEAKDLLDNATFTGQHNDEAERLGAVLFLRELARPLGSEADARRRLEADPNNAQLRYELGCLIAAAGRYSEALEWLLGAAQRDPRLGAAKVRAAMVKIFQIVGVRSAIADEYRDKLATLLY